MKQISPLLIILFAHTTLFGQISDKKIQKAKEKNQSIGKMLSDSEIGPNLYRYIFVTDLKSNEAVSQYTISAKKSLYQKKIEDEWPIQELVDKVSQQGIIMKGVKPAITEAKEAKKYGRAPSIKNPVIKILYRKVYLNDSIVSDGGDSAHFNNTSRLSAPHSFKTFISFSEQKVAKGSYPFNKMPALLTSDNTLRIEDTYILKYENIRVEKKFKSTIEIKKDDNQTLDFVLKSLKFNREYTDLDNQTHDNDILKKVKTSYKNYYNKNGLDYDVDIMAVLKREKFIKYSHSSDIDYISTSFMLIVKDSKGNYYDDYVTFKRNYFGELNYSDQIHKVKVSVYREKNNSKTHPIIGGWLKEIADYLKKNKMMDLKK